MDHTDQCLSSLASINMDKSRSNLTTLPVEVRLCMYEYGLTTPYRLVRPGKGTVVGARPLMVTLLQANQQIHQEATPVFYRINSFYINVMAVLPDLQEDHFKYGLPSSELKVLLSRVTCPILHPSSLRFVDLVFVLIFGGPGAKDQVKGGFSFGWRSPRRVGPTSSMQL